MADCRTGEVGKTVKKHRTLRMGKGSFELQAAVTLV